MLIVIINNNCIKYEQAGWTALMWTCYKGRYEAATVLLARGANPNVKGEVRTKPKYILYFDLLVTRSDS